MRHLSGIIPITAAVLVAVFFAGTPSNDGGARPGKGTVLPLTDHKGGKPLEPSGLVLFQKRLLFVSDNRDDSRLYELVPGTDRCVVKVFLTFRDEDLLKLKKRHNLDLEGITYWNEYFYAVDERDRFIYRISLYGKVCQVHHDIIEYSKSRGIVFSSDENAGFEGITVDPARNMFFIANERADPVIYLLRQTPDYLELSTEDHIPMKDILGGDHADISALCWNGGALYVLHRIGNRILRMDPYTKKVTGNHDFSGDVAGVYVSRKGHGFTEGLAMTPERIYLVMDSNGGTMEGRSHGAGGALVILDRPSGF